MAGFGNIDPQVLEALREMGVSAAEAGEAIAKMGDAVHDITPDTPAIVIGQITSALEGHVLFREEKVVRDRSGQASAKVIRESHIRLCLIDEFEVAADGVIGANFTIRLQGAVPARLDDIAHSMAQLIENVVPYNPEVELNQIEYLKEASAYGRILLHPTPETPPELLPDGVVVEEQPQPVKRKRRLLDLD
jgi:hypothetical protein